MQVLCKRLTPTSRLPVRSSKNSAGYDLYSDQEVTVRPGHRKLIKTGICLEIPDGHYGRIAPRSSLARDFGINVGAGVIDPDYRGEVMILLFNHGEKDLEIHVGDRIAQIIFEKISTPVIIETEKISETSRGTGGFGSTGK
jgi:dUTP pyrophosphatase